MKNGASFHWLTEEATAQPTEEGKLRFANNPLNSPNTQLIAAAMTSGFKLMEPGGYRDTVEQTSSGSVRRVEWFIDVCRIHSGASAPADHSGNGGGVECGGGPNRRGHSPARQSGTGRAPKLLGPAWIASRVFTLAKETGWSEEFILWELPLCRALACQHCALWQAGAWTIAPQPSPEAPLAQLEQLSNLEILEDE